MAAREYDFYSPFVSASIVSDDGTVYPLWVDSTATGSPSQASQKALKDWHIASLAFVSSVSVRMMLGGLNEVTATLTPPFEDGRAFLNSPLAEFGNKRLKIQFGYSSGTPKGAVLSPMFDVLLIHAPEVSLGTDMTITIKGQGSILASTFNVQRSGIFTGTRLEIIKKMAAGPDGGRPVLVDADAVLKDNTDSRSKELLTEQPITITPGFQTEWFLIQQLVRDSLCWSYCLNDTLVLLPRNGKVLEKPKYRFSFYDFDGNIGPVAGTMPITSMSISNPIVFLPTTVLGVLIPGVDSASKSTDPRTVTNQEAQAAVYDKGGGAPAASQAVPGAKGQDGTSATLLDRNNPEAVNKATAQVQDASGGMGLGLDLDTLGVPDLLPGDTIYVSGVSEKRADGHYGVFEITHEFSGSGFTTKLKCFANTAKMLATLIEAQAPSNTEQAPKPEDRDFVLMRPKPQPPELVRAPDPNASFTTSSPFGRVPR